MISVGLSVIKLCLLQVFIPQYACNFSDEFCFFELLCSSFTSHLLLYSKELLWKQTNEWYNLVLWVSVFNTREIVCEVHNSIAVLVCIYSGLDLLRKLFHT